MSFRVAFGSATSLVKLPSLTPSKISTKPVDIFVENLGRWRSAREILRHSEPRLKFGQYLQGIELTFVFTSVNQIFASFRSASISSSHFFHHNRYLRPSDVCGASL